MSFLIETLGCLTAMKSGCYTSMSDSTKLEIKNQFYAYCTRIEADPTLIFGEPENDLTDCIRN
jgi:hypothetical protein